MEISKGKIRIKSFEEKELRPFWEISFGPRADLEWMNWNGPYFNYPVVTWDEFRNGFGEQCLNNPNRAVIWYDNQMIGIVTAGWEDGELKQWLDFGIAIYIPDFWSKGIGFEALTLWMSYLFMLYDYLPHISFTTWSGNKGMMKLGEKLGMTKEAQIRKVRYWKGTYYDSIQYGLLRDEWEK